MDKSRLKMFPRKSLSVGVLNELKTGKWSAYPPVLISALKDDAELSLGRVEGLVQTGKRGLETEHFKKIASIRSGAEILKKQLAEVGAVEYEKINYRLWSKLSPHQKINNVVGNKIDLNRGASIMLGRLCDDVGIGRIFDLLIDSLQAPKLSITGSYFPFVKEFCHWFTLNEMHLVGGRESARDSIFASYDVALDFCCLVISRDICFDEVAPEDIKRTLTKKLKGHAETKFQKIFEAECHKSLAAWFD